MDRRNRIAATCSECGQRVAPRAGVCEVRAGAARVRHRECPPPVAASAAVPSRRVPRARYVEPFALPRLSWQESGAPVRRVAVAAIAAVIVLLAGVFVYRGGDSKAEPIDADPSPEGLDIARVAETSVPPSTASITSAVPVTVAVAAAAVTPTPTPTNPPPVSVRSAPAAAVATEVAAATTAAPASTEPSAPPTTPAPETTVPAPTTSPATDPPANRAGCDEGNRRGPCRNDGADRERQERERQAQRERQEERERQEREERRRDEERAERSSREDRRNEGRDRVRGDDGERDDDDDDDDDD